MMEKVSIRCMMAVLLCGVLLLTGCSGTTDDGSATTTTVGTTTGSSDDTTTTTAVNDDVTGTSASVDGDTTTTVADVVITTAVNQTTTTIPAGTPVADVGLVRIGFADSVGTIEVDKEAKLITIPVRGDADLTGKLPATQASAGYTVTLTNGTDLNSDLTYTVSNGKTTEQWKVITKEDYTGIIEAVSLKVRSIFGKGAVLQRDKEVPVWGFCEGADIVVVEFAGQRKRGVVQKDGYWEVTLDPMSAISTGKTLTVSTAGEKVENKNLLVGDVWFCSGQSNMEYWPLNAEETNSLSALKTSKLIRMFDVAEVWNKQPLSEFDGGGGTWKNAANYAAEQWSMYALSFAYALRQELDVPIGIIVAAEGGTIIEHWLPDASLVAAGTSRNTPQRGHGIKQNVGTGMYNSMVYPLKGLAVKGILWYQGEANTNATSDYTRLFTEYAKHYREFFKDPQLPIITTQLPKYGAPDYPNWVSFRLTQWNIAEQIDNVHIVSAIDMGEEEDIHPADKWPLGLRAADLALNKVYGKATPGESAYPSSVTQSGNTVTIRFKDAESGLTLSDGTVARELYGITAGGSKAAPTAVTLNGDTMVATFAETIVRVEYAMSNVPNVNLYAKNGLPVAPFSWKLS